MACNDWEKIEQSIHASFDSHAAAILIHIEPLRELMQTDPDKAADMLPALYDRAINTACTDEKHGNMRAFGESIAGPFEGEGRAVSNIVGCFYPHFDRQRQDRMLAGLFRIYDFMNYGYVNGSRGVGITEGIHEPLLLRDIAIARPLYWPGLDEGKQLLQKYPDFVEWQEKFLTEEGRFRPGKVESEFLVAYRLLRSDSCSFSEAFIECAEPEFLERTVQAIVGTRFGGAISKDKDKEQHIVERTARLRELLPASLHDRIDQYRTEKRWTDWRKFSSEYDTGKYDSLVPI